MPNLDFFPPVCFNIRALQARRVEIDHEAARLQEDPGDRIPPPAAALRADPARGLGAAHRRSRGPAPGRQRPPPGTRPAPLGAPDPLAGV